LPKANSLRDGAEQNVTRLAALFDAARRTSIHNVRLDQEMSFQQEVAMRNLFGWVIAFLIAGIGVALDFGGAVTVTALGETGLLY
jgi:hypothetical protein